MPKTKIVGSAGRFGVRYGQLVKRRIAAIESKQRKKQICHFCGGIAKRKSKGIWNCQKCGKTFAQHAYFLGASGADSESAEASRQNAKALKPEKLKKDIGEEKKKSPKTKK